MASLVNGIFKYFNLVLSLCPPVFMLGRALFGLLMAVLLYIPMVICRFGVKRVFLTEPQKRERPSLDFFNSESTNEVGFVTSDGVDIHLVTRGDPNGKVVLFLHGFPECWYSWSNQLEFFARNGFRAVAMSMRGYAESGKPSGKDSYKILNLVNDVKEAIEYLGVDQVYLVAHDWGGAIGWVIGALHPTLIKRLIILNAPFHQIFFDLQMGNLRQFLLSWYIYFFQWPYLPEMAIRMGDFAFLELCFQRLLKKGRMSQTELDLFKYYASKPGALTCMVNYYRMAAKNAKTEVKRIKNIKVPTLVIWGEADEALVIENLKGLSNYVDDLQVTRLPGVTHWVQQEDPDTVNKEIYSFIT
ncbi:AB hydrolase superfamily protein YfhM-like [Convolutriloba macropyga]|uniref:AB hydrolase superfamily protein YfhM-like n=1 Tax=Convolutriloba macropyga TaxID=536237 RepID=UPI003F525550